MKIQLNLIPGRTAPFRLKSLRRILSIASLLAFFLLIIAMGYIYIDNYYEIEGYQNQLTLISKKNDILNKEVFQIIEYKREWDSLQYKISLVSELREKQIWWTPKLQAFAELIPENIWIDKLFVKESVQAPRTLSSPQANTVQTQIHSSMLLILEGFALPGGNQGFRSIENFAQQLKENPAFSKIIQEIDLTTATRTEREEISAMSFQLSCRLVAEENL